MYIATDFSQPKTFDIIIGKGPTEGREMHETGRFLDDIRLDITPTYLRCGFKRERAGYSEKL